MLPPTAAPSCALVHPLLVCLYSSVSTHGAWAHLAACSSKHSSSRHLTCFPFAMTDEIGSTCSGVSENSVRLWKEMVWGI